MVLWHFLILFDTFWYFLTPVFRRAPAPRGGPARSLPFLYLFFTVLRFLVGSVFKEQRATPQTRPGTEMPFRRGRARRQSTSRMCTIRRNKARKNSVYAVTGYKLDVVGREGGGAGRKEQGAGPVK